MTDVAIAYVLMWFSLFPMFRDRGRGVIWSALAAAAWPLFLAEMIANWIDKVDTEQYL